METARTIYVDGNGNTYYRDHNGSRIDIPAPAPRIEVEATAHTPIPWEANIGDRLSDDTDCWVIDSGQGSIAEMQCPKDVEEINARFIVRSVNSHQALVDAAKQVLEDITECGTAEPYRYLQAITTLRTALALAGEPR